MVGMISKKKCLEQRLSPACLQKAQDLNMCGCCRFPLAGHRLDPTAFSRAQGFTSTRNGWLAEVVGLSDESIVQREG